MPSYFGGRLLTADDLVREQTAIAKAESKEFTITKKTDTATTLLDGAADDLLGVDTGLDEATLLPWVQGDQLF